MKSKIRNSSNWLVWRPFLVWSLGVISLCLSLQVSGQTVEHSGGALDSRLTEITAEISSLNKQLEVARGENRGPLRQRLWTQQEQYRQEVWRYVDSREPDGSDSLDGVTGLLDSVSTSLRRQIDINNDRISALQLAAESAEGPEAEKSREDLGIAERHRTDLLADLVGNVTRLQRFGLPAEEDAAQAIVLLRNRAQWLSGRIELEKLRRDGFSASMAEFDAESADYKDAKQQLAAADVVVSRSAEQLSNVADLLETLGQDVTEYRQTEFMATGNLSAEFFDTRVVDPSCPDGFLT